MILKNETIRKKERGEKCTEKIGLKEFAIPTWKRECALRVRGSKYLLPTTKRIL